MALSDLLVYVDKTSDAIVRLRLAVDLAARHGAHLTALFVRERTESELVARRAAELGLASADQVDLFDRRAEASMEQAAQELRLALEGFAREHGVATDWRLVDGPASVAVAQHARYADLCLVGHYPMTDDDPEGFTFTERLLFTSGRPVLSVPSHGHLVSLGRHVAVAWNSSRAAARALNDALPLIEGAERTTLLTVNSDDFIGRHGGLPAERLVEHLTRHNVETRLVQLDGTPTGAIAEALQAKAQEVGADLLVAGAFGHPRLWERLLGGVTRDLLDHMHMPTMMSN
jgi:nucleotide-binding universal stress UspA family protein